MADKTHLSEARLALLGHIPPSQFIGGLKTFIQNLITAFPNMEFFPLPDWPSTHFLTRYHSKIWYLNWFKNDFIYSRYLLAQHNKKPFDLLFTYSCIGSSFNKKLLSVPTIHIHFGCLVEFVNQTTKNPMEAAIQRVILKRMEKRSCKGKHCVAISEQVKNEVKQHYGHDSITIPLGVDLDFFSPQDRRETRQQLNWKEDVPTGLYVGRAEYAKGWDILLEVAKALPKVAFICITDFKNPSLLENIVIKKDVSADELKKWYNAADFFILPSRYESASLVTLEAMSCNLSAIISREVAKVVCGDSNLNVFDEDEGVYIVNDGAKGYIKAIEASLKNKKSAMRHFIEKHHSLQKFREKYRELAVDLLRSSRAPWIHARPLEFCKTPTGNYYLPSGITTDIVINEIKNGRIYDQKVVDTAKRYITKGSAVIDVGACFGQMSAIFSKLVGDSGEILAFEADSFIFSILQKNITTNKLTNVRSFCRAVYDQNDIIMHYPVPEFAKFDSYGSYSLEPKTTSGRQVKTITIDSIVIEKPISFMKIDAQGCDLFVLRGAVETIRRHRMPFIFEFEEVFQEKFGTSFNDYLSFVNQISYKIKSIIDGINYLVVPKS